MYYVYHSNPLTSYGYLHGYKSGKLTMVHDDKYWDTYVWKRHFRVSTVWQYTSSLSIKVDLNYIVDKLLFNVTVQSLSLYVIFYIQNTLMLVTRD